MSIEYTDDPHPRNIYWEMFGLPMFDLAEPDGVLAQINECRAAFPGHYIRVLAYDATLGRQSTAMSFLVQSPASEPGRAPAGLHCRFDVDLRSRWPPADDTDATLGHDGARPVGLETGR